MSGFDDANFDDMSELRKEREEAYKVRQAEREKNKQRLLDDMGAAHVGGVNSTDMVAKATYMQALATMHIALECYTRDE